MAHAHGRLTFAPPHGPRHQQTRFNLESGRREEEERAADSGIVYKFSINIKPSPPAACAGNIPGRIPDAPA
jgi:hypothetical protein